MHQEVYKEMNSTGIACKLDKEVFLDKSYGGIVEHEEEGFGLKTQYYLERPDKLIFVDEVGSNTSQANNRNMGSEKLLCIGSNHSQEFVNTKDAHFTMLGFTMASGEAVMCCIIFAASQLDSLWAQGFNPLATWEGKEFDMEEKTSEKESGTLKDSSAPTMEK
jgi:hypothetical protein